MSDELTVAERRYLKAAWYVVRDGGSLSISSLADRLDVSHPSASSIVGRLVSHKLLRRLDKREFGLTSSGEEQALRLVRRHRLMETFLSEILGLPWDELHDEAESLEWSISDRLEDRIAAVLGHPSRDPHGDPIPAPDGHHDEMLDLPLADLDVGEESRIVRVDDRDPELLRYLSDRGLVLGSVVHVEGREPFGGPLRLTSAGSEYALGPVAVEAIWVSPPGDEAHPTT